MGMERLTARLAVALLAVASITAGSITVAIAAHYTGDDAFPDVPSTHEHAAEINAAHAAGLFNGLIDGTFDPDSNLRGSQGVKLARRLLDRYTDEDLNFTVTRGEAAALIMTGFCGFHTDAPACENVAGGLPASGGGGAFSDVPDTHEYAAEINAGRAAGLFNGRVDGTFGPDVRLYRLQAAKLALRLADRYTTDTGETIRLPAGVTVEGSPTVTRAEVAVMMTTGICGYAPDSPGCRNR